MAVPIYLLCTFTAALCALLLFRAHRHNRRHLLFWSGWCFAVLTVANFVIVLDRVVFPDTDLLFWRLGTQLLALLLLLYGLIWHED